MIPDRFLELDQYRMATNPEEAAKSLGMLLNLDDAEIASVARQMREKRTESTGPADNIISDLAELNWSHEQMNMFQEKCGGEMAAYGYAYDSTYTK
jgi:cyanate lyase